MMKLKLFDFEKYEDYGWEFFFQLLTYYPKFALLDITIQLDEFPATEIFPMLLISFGSRSLCGFSFRWKWLQIRCDIIQTRPRNLKAYGR